MNLILRIKNHFRWDQSAHLRKRQIDYESESDTGQYLDKDKLKSSRICYQKKIDWRQKTMQFATTKQKQKLKNIQSRRPKVLATLLMLFVIYIITGCLNIALAACSNCARGNHSSCASADRRYVGNGTSKHNIVCCDGSYTFTANQDCTWGSYTITTNPTCTAAGVKTRKCNYCTNKSTDTVAALGHSYKAAWSSDATNHWHDCIRCTSKSSQAAHTDTSSYNGFCDTCNRHLYNLANAPTANTYIYDGSAHTGISSGPGYTISGTNSATDAGTYTVTATLVSGYRWSDYNNQTGVRTYNWTINKKTLVGTADNKTRIYGEANPTFTITFSGQVSNQTPAYSGSPTTTATAASNVSTYTITQGNVALANNGAFKASNYTLSFVNGVLTVDRRPIVCTAADQTLTYGQTINTTDTTKASLGVAQTTPSGPLTGHKIGSILLTQSTVNYVTDGTITPSSLVIYNDSNQDVTSNYSIGYKAGKLVINKKTITIIWSPTERIYNGKQQVPGAAVDPNDGPVYNEVLTLEVKNSKKDVGVYTGANQAEVVITKVTNGNARETNYRIVNPKTNWEIKKKVLNAYPTNRFSKIYLQEDPQIIPEFSWTVNGITYTDLENGEVPGYTGTLQRAPGEAIGRYNITGIGTFTLQNNGAFKVSNYDFQYHNYIRGTSNLAYFTIYAKNIEGGKVTISPSEFTYDATAHTVTPTLVVDGRTLVLDTDYRTTYYDNINAGTARIEFEGIGNYTGINESRFVIHPADISKQPTYNNFTIDPVYSTYTYDGTEKKPGAIVKFKGVVLEEGVDYTISWRDNVNAGNNTAAITITGKGNFTGIKEATFTINKKQLAGTGELDQTRYNYDNTEKFPRVLYFRDTDGVELVQGRDYTISYRDNVEVGVGKVIITGINNYEGTVILTFDIFKAEPIVTLKDKTAVYSGQPVYINEATVTNIFNYRGDSTDVSAKNSLEYKYYKDQGLTEELENGAPIEVGVYFVQARLPEDANHAEVFSNIAKIIIYGAPSAPRIEANDGIKVIPSGSRVGSGVYVNIFGAESELPKEVLVKYKYRFDTTSAWIDYTETIRLTEERTYKIYAKAYVYDNPDDPNTQSEETVFEVTIDHTAPTPGGITVPQEADSVVIDVSVDNPEIQWLYITEDPNKVPNASDPWKFVGSDEFGEQGKTIYELSQGDGNKTLYVWQKDEAGNMVGTPTTVTVKLNAVKIGNNKDNKTTFFFKTTDDYHSTSNIMASDIVLYVNGFPTTGRVTQLSRENTTTTHKFTAVIEDVTGDGNLSFKVNKLLIYDKAGNNIYDNNQEVPTNEITIDNTLPVLRVNTEKDKAFIYIEDEHIKAVMQNGSIIGRKNGEYVVTMTYGRNEFVVIDEYGNDVTLTTTYETPLEEHHSIPNPPQLQEDQLAVYYHNGSPVTTTFFTDNMYDYKSTTGNNNVNSEWANSQTPDGSMWVWIPRFAYKKTYYTNNSYNVETTTETQYYKYKIVFLKNRSNEFMDQNGNLNPLPTGYTVASAFTSDTNNGGSNYELLGFWIAKYEMSNNGGKPASRPGVTPWTNITVGNAYTVSKNLYPKFSSHLMKNSEYEATLILGLGEYGRNGNNITLDNTAATGTNNNTSTTGNITGVFDMIGGSWEYTASYVSGLSSTSANNLVSSTNAGFKEVLNSTKVSNIILSNYEAGLSGLPGLYNTTKVVYRGVDTQNSIVSVNNGDANARIGFRTVIGYDKSTESEDDPETNTTTEGGTVTYYPNGGTGAIKTVFARSNTPYVILENTFFDKPGYKVVGWGTTPTTQITDAHYVAGQSITVTEDLDLYAIWAENAAQYISGSAFNQAIKRAAGNASATSATVDNSIQRFEWQTGRKEEVGVPANAINVSSTDVPMYVWYDSGTIKIWTDASVIRVGTDMSSMFNNLNALQNVNFVSDLNITSTNTVTNMSNMFNGCNSLTSLSVVSLNTANVTDMHNMFSNCSNLSNLNTAGLNTAKVTNMSSMFEGDTHLTSLDVHAFDTGLATNMSSMFKNCSGLATINLNSFNTANVTNMSSMFEGCSSLTNLNLLGFNTTKVTNMSSMFSGTSNIEIYNLSSFTTTALTNMNSMFKDCSSATTINLSSFNTSAVTDMAQLFYGCSSLSNIDLSNFDIGSVQTMESMFENDTGITTLDLRSFNTSVLTNTSKMFKNASNLEKIYATTAFDKTGITSSNEMFTGCTSIYGGNGTHYSASHVNKEYARIDLNNTPGYFWCTDTYTITFNPNGGNLSDVPASVTKTYGESFRITSNVPLKDGGIFKGWDEDATVTVPTYKAGDVFSENRNVVLKAIWLSTSAQYVDGNTFNALIKEAAGNSSATYDSANSNIHSISWETTAPAEGVLNSAKNVGANTGAPIYAWLEGNTLKLYTEASNVTFPSDMSGMFNNLTGLQSINPATDLGVIDSSNVSNMSSLFSNCSGLTSVNLEDLNTANVTDMSGMFADATSITTVDLSRLNTINVLDMSDMFNGCTSLTGVNVEDINTINVTDMSGMFKNCTSLVELELSNLRTANVTDMTEMFAGDTNIQKICVSDLFDTSSVNTSTNMFNGDTNIRGGSGTVYTPSKVDAEYAVIDGINDLNGYLWCHDTYIVSFDANAGYELVLNVPDDITKTYGVPITIPTPAPSREEYIFQGWVISLLDLTTKYHAGDTYNVNKNVTLKAIWKNNYAKYLSGSEFNVAIKKLVNSSVTSHTQVNTNIIGFEWQSSEPNSSALDNAIIVSDPDLTPIYAWLDGNTVKLWSVSETIELDDDISNMFAGFSGLQNFDLMSNLNLTDTENITDMKGMFSNTNISGTFSLSGIDSSNVTDMSSMFNGANITNFNVGSMDTSSVRDMSYMFANSKMTSVDLSGFNTGLVQNMTSMFENANTLTGLDLTSFNVSGVTNMSNMFKDCTAITSINISTFNTNMVETMQNMFLNCGNLQTLSLGDLSVISVTNMESMFEGCSSLTALNLSSFTTESATTMKNMFKGCSSLAALNVESFDTSHVTDMSAMFKDCDSLTELELKSFNTGSLTNANEMFNSMNSIQKIYVSEHFTTNTIASSSAMFTGSTNIVGGNGTTYSTSYLDKTYARMDKPGTPGYFWSHDEYTITFNANGGDMQNVPETMTKQYGVTLVLTTEEPTRETYIFKGWAETTSTVVPDYVAGAEYTKNEDKILYAVWVRDFATYDVGATFNQKIKRLVSGQSAATVDTVDTTITSIAWDSTMTSPSELPATYVDVSSDGAPIYAWLDGSTIKLWSESDVVMMNENSSSMFKNLNGLTTFNPITALNVPSSSNVTNMSSIFEGTAHITNLDLSTFDTSHATNMSNMFKNMDGLTEIGLTDIDTSSATNLSGMFSELDNVSRINLVDLDLSSAVDLSDLFKGSAIISMDFMGLNTSHVTDMSGMFDGCTALIEVDFSTIDTSNVEDFSRLFNGCTSLGVINMANLSTESATDLSNMFSGCTTIEQIDIESFDTREATNTSEMFKGDTSLERIYASERFVNTGITTSTDMFTGSTNIKGGNGTVYTAAHIDKEYARIDKDGVPGYFWCKETYTITFNANGGPGLGTITSPMTKNYGEDLTIIGEIAPRDEYIFKGWSTAQDATVAEYTDTYDKNKDATLYAVWKAGSSKYVAGALFNQAIKRLAGTNATSANTLDTNVTAIAWSNVAPSETDRNNAIKVNDTNVSSITRAANCIDVSVATSGQPIYAWFEEDGNTGKGTIKLWADSEMIRMNEDASKMFRNFDGLTAINPTADLGITLTNEVTTMEKMFYGCGSLATITFDEAFNTESVQNMEDMFNACTSLTSLDISVLKSDSLKDMSKMFHYCTNLDTITFGIDFTTDLVEDMFGLFDDCNKLTTVDISRFNTSNVKNMSRMFYDCYKLVNIDLSNFNTSSVTDMGAMFYRCEKINYLNLDGFYTENVTDMSYMFYNCGHDTMTSLDLGDNFNTQSVTNMAYMFYGCGDAALISINLGDNFDTRNVTKMNSMFENCGYNAMTSLDLGDKFDTSSVTNMSDMFTNCGYKSMTSLDLGDNFDTSSVTDMTSMFFNCGHDAMTSLDLGDNFDTSSVTSMYCMFNKCGYGAMTSLDLGDNFDTSNVTNMESMFYGCGYTAMTSLDLGDKFDTSSVTNMSDMFTNCGYKSMTSLDLGDSFNTSSVTDMEMMFAYCGYNLMTSLDLGNLFNTINVTNMYHMFYNCINLQRIYAPTVFVVEAGTNTLEMFDRCHEIRGGNGTTYSASHVDGEYAWIDGRVDTTTGNSRPGYFWCHDTYVITFNSNASGDASLAGMPSGDKTKVYGEPLELPEVPTRDGFTFKGWSTDPTATIGSYDATRPYTVNAGTTLYATWHADNAKYVTGQLFNQTIKQLAGNSGATYNSSDAKIKAIKWQSGDTFTKQDVPVGARNVSSYGPIIFAWFEEDTAANDGTGIIKLWSEAESLRFDNNMSYMFNYLTNISSISIKDDLHVESTNNVENMAYLFNDCYKLAYIDTMNFDTSNVDNMSNMFSSCKSMASIDLSNFDTRNVIDMSNMFDDFGDNYSNPEIVLSGWDTSNVKNFSYMFSSTKINTINVSHFNTSNAEDMSGMFYYCDRLTSINVSSFNTHKVTNMNAMFACCNNLSNIIGIENFNTIRAENVGGMFYECLKLTNLDLSSWNVSSVQYFSGPGMNCRYDETTWHDPGIFEKCIRLKTLDLTDWNTLAATQMSYMFYRCTDLERIYASSTFVTNNVTSDTNMFGYCTSIEGGNGTVFSGDHIDKEYARIDGYDNLPGYFWCHDTYEVTFDDNAASGETVTGMPTEPKTKEYGIALEILEEPERDGNIFRGWSENPNAASGDYYSLNPYTKNAAATLYAIWKPNFAMYVNGQIFNEVIKSLAANQNVPYSNADHTIKTIEWSNTAPSGDLSLAIKAIDAVDEIDSSSIVDVSCDGAPIYAWYDASRGRIKLYSDSGVIKLNNDASYMFSELESLYSINVTEDLNVTDTSNVTNMSNMFSYAGYRAISFEIEDASSWDTSNVTNMSEMFHNTAYEAESMNIGDISNWDVSNVTDMSGMFSGLGCYNLTTINLDLEGWDTSSVTNMSSMFENCSSLNRIYVSTSFVTTEVLESTNMFNNSTSLEGGNGTVYDNAHIDGEYAWIDGRVDTTTGNSRPGYFWCHDTYTITFNTNAGNDLVTGMPSGDKTKNYGEPLEVLEVPARDGSIFKGWSEDSTAATAEYDATHPYIKNADATLYAIWGSASAQYIDGDSFNKAVRLLTGDTSVDISALNTRITKFTKVDTAPSAEDIANAVVVKDVTINSSNINTSTPCLNVSANEIPIYAWFDNGEIKLYCEASNIIFNEDMTNMFRNLSHLASIDLLADTGVTDTSNVQIMANLFKKDSALTTLDLSVLDTSNVTSMESLCSNCTSLTSVDLSGLNTENVVNMHEMFRKSTALHEVDLSSFNTEQVTDMSGMFQECSALEKIYASSTSFVTSAVTNSADMFASCSSHLKGGNGTVWSSSNPKDKTYARIDGQDDLPGYFWCKDTYTITLVENASGDTVTGMPEGNIKIKTYGEPLEFPEILHRDGYFHIGWSIVPDATIESYDSTHPYTTNASTTLYAVWENEYAKYLPGTEFNSVIKQLAGNSNANEETENTNITKIEWQTSITDVSQVPSTAINVSVSDNNQIFAWFDNGTIKLWSDSDRIELNENSSYMFANLKNLTTLNVTDDLGLTHDSKNVIDMHNMFMACGYTSMTSLEMGSHFDTSDVIDMSQMFYDCGHDNLTSLDLGDKFDTSNVTNMHQMFRATGMNKLPVLDLGDNFDTSNVTDMSDMFRYCGELKLVTLDLGDKFDTSNVTNMSKMFINCGDKLMKTLDLGEKFDTSKVKNMSEMFRNCKALETIYAPTSFVTTAVTDSANMFKDSTKLKGGNGTAYSASHINAGYAWIDGRDGLPGYFTNGARATYVTGVKFNRAVKMLAGNSNVSSTTFEDSKVTSIEWSSTAPTGDLTSAIPVNDTYTGIDENALLDLSITDVPIYAWSETSGDYKVIKLYSDVYKAYLNADSSSMFRDFGKLSSLDLGPSSTEKVKNMSTMFSQAGRSVTTFDLDLSGWDTSSVTNMSDMFYYAGYTVTTFDVDLSGWDTSSVTNMSEMFLCAGRNAATFDIGGLSGWNTSSVNRMSSMFYYAGGSAPTFDLDLSGWETSSVTNMSSMFKNAGYSATTWSIGDISGWETSSVTDMSSMFEGAGYSATTWSLGDISGWDTSLVRNMALMFSVAGRNANTFELDLSGWNTSRVTNISKMFFWTGYTATTFEINLSGWNTSRVMNMSKMFESAGYNATTFDIDLSGWNNTSSVTNMSDMFKNAGYNATSFELDVSGWNTSSVTDMSGLFSLTGHEATRYVLDLSDWDTPNVTSMTNMFAGAGNKATTWSIGNLSGWNTSSVTDMSYMFMNAGSSATIWSIGDISGWNTSSVTKMSGMFNTIGTAVTTFELNLSGWNTSNVTRMDYMFYQAGYNATTFELDLSGWNTSNVTRMDNMFASSGITKIYTSTSFVTTSVTNSTNMFKNCTSLVGGNGTVYDSNHVDAEYAWIDGRDGLPGYFWCKDTYTISFNANAGSDTVTGMPSGDKTKSYDVPLEIPETPERTDYIFKGWATTSDATVAEYDATHPYTPNVATTLYAVWEFKGAVLVDGNTFNQTIKRLAGKSSATRDTQDVNVKSIVLTSDEPTAAQKENAVSVKTTEGADSVTAETVCANVSQSEVPVYAWFEVDTEANNGKGTIKLWTETSKIKMNEDSSRMFNQLLYMELLDFPNIDTSSVTNMRNMFYNAGRYSSTFDIEDISEWDTSSVIYMDDMFNMAGYNAPSFNLDLSGWNTSSVTDMSGIFAYMGYNSTTWSIGDLSEWDTSSVTNMSRMFSNASYKVATFDIGDISEWDTSNVTDMNNMFYWTGNSATTFNLDLSGWDTSSVTDMEEMFGYTGNNATTWSIGDISGWDTSSVTTMASMFYYAGCGATTWNVGDISKWDTSSVTNMARMFFHAGCHATTLNLNLSGWDTSNVTDISRMFCDIGYYSTSVNLNVSGWDTSSVTNMQAIFSSSGYKTTTYQIVGLSDWDTSSVTNMSSMFSLAGHDATSWNIGDISGWDTSSVTNMASMLYYAGYNAPTFDLDLSDWDTSKVTLMTSMFSNAGRSATTWSLRGLSSWDTSSVTNMASMFEAAGRNAETFELDLSGWDTSSVTAMSKMFKYTGYLSNVWNVEGLSNWDTQSVTTMASMFYYAGNYRSSIPFKLDLSNWDTSSVTTMDSMFYGIVENAPTFELDLSGWDVSSLTTTYRMLNYAGRNATTFKADLSGWRNMLNITNMSEMFYLAGHSVNTTTVEINVSGWNTSNVTNMSRMFSSVGHYVTTPFELDLSSWNTSNVTDMSDMFNYSGVNRIYTSSSFVTTSVTSSTDMFDTCINLVGGRGTTYGYSNPRDKTYAHIDGGVSNPGYFTAKT